VHLPGLLLDQLGDQPRPTRLVAGADACAVIATDYHLEGALPADERARFADHLAHCQGCSNYLNQMQQTIRLTGTLTEDALEPAARDELLKLFRDWKKT
jgi:anti-sigma factor RsiW